VEEFKEIADEVRRELLGPGFESPGEQAGSTLSGSSSVRR